MVEHQILVLRVVGSNPAISTNISRVGRGVQAVVCKTTYIGSNPVPDSKCPRGVMDSTPDYGSVSEGSSPSGDTRCLTINIVNTIISEYEEVFRVL